MKKTKILATFGPAIASESAIRQLVKCGANAFRINCSHGKTDDFKKAARLIRRATKASPFPVGLLFDISGPKLRLADFSGELDIQTGERIELTTGTSNLPEGKLGVNHPAIISSLRKGQRLYIDDGYLVFDVVSAGKKGVVLQAGNSGCIRPRKGINLPESKIDIPTIGPKDREDIKTAIEAGADYIALSFVRSGDDLIEARRLIKRYGGNQKLIAKLEKREAIEDLDNIMLLLDGVMIARGDLGVELPPEKLPTLQRDIIRMANRHHKPVIVATQMLESMRFSPRATRAEINDVASAVFDYVDCVMLSAETAAGKYPKEAVETMASVITETEESAVRPDIDLGSHLIQSTVPLVIAQSVSRADQSCKTTHVFAFTTSGFTAEMISNLYPPQPVIVLTPDTAVMRRLSLYRSLYPVQIKQPGSFSEMLAAIEKIGKKFKLTRKGDRVILTGGAPFGSTVPTNFMMFHEMS
jgi:pyruvate kinase